MWMSGTANRDLPTKGQAGDANGTGNMHANTNRSTGEAINVRGGGSDSDNNAKYRTSSNKRAKSKSKQPHPLDGMHGTRPWSPPKPDSEELFGLLESSLEICGYKMEIQDGTYRRFKGENVEKEAFVENGDMGVFPISPIHTPSVLGKYLMAEFDKPVYVSPKKTTILYATLPVEIGIFARFKDRYETVDVFSPKKQKYALYGLPNDGFICRWAMTTPSTAPAKETDFPKEAHIKLILKNSMSGWAKFDKAVFPAERARIYYGNGKMAYSTVEIEIVNKGFSRSSIHDRTHLDQLQPAPLSTLHPTSLKLTELPLFKPESTIVMGGY
ncbi:MAG TPA: DUF432 domain-containing protein [Euryarchaeota archaeon]|nr:DUF432 domain-containing protein [Euryarchaeota archaeon]